MKKPVLLYPFLLLLFQGCFSIREPEPPSTAGGWISPTQPSILIDNFRTAVTSLNTVNYDRCFVAQGYRFSPDPEAQGSSTGIFDNWSVLDERTYFSKLKESSSVTSANKLLFTEPSQVFYSADSLEYNARYELSLQHEEADFRHYNFTGTIRLILRRKENEWQISSWQDTRRTDSLCWTDLKQYFYTH